MSKAALTIAVRELVKAEPTLTNAKLAVKFGLSTGYISEICRLGGIELSRANAAGRVPANRDIQKSKPKSIHVPRSRPCITCGGNFWSEGPHNRMCNDCGRENSSEYWS